MLALTVGFLPLCQVLVLLGRHKILGTDIAEVAESLELLVGALGLTAIHLLNRENGDRRSTDKRLRVAEATPAPQLAGHIEANPEVAANIQIPK